MGRRRKKPLEPGKHTNFYIPEDVDSNVLEFINEQQNLSKTIIGLIHEKVYGENDSSKFDMQHVEQYIKSLFEKFVSSNEGSNEESKEVIKNKVLKNLDFSRGYEKK